MGKENEGRSSKSFKGRGRRTASGLRAVLLLLPPPLLLAGWLPPHCTRWPLSQEHLGGSQSSEVAAKDHIRLRTRHLAQSRGAPPPLP